MARQIAEVDRVGRVRDVDERGAGRAADDRVLLASGLVGPAPDVVQAAAPDVGARHEFEQIDAVARVDAGHPLLALDQVLRRERRGGLGRVPVGREAGEVVGQPLFRRGRASLGGGEWRDQSEGEQRDQLGMARGVEHRSSNSGMPEVSGLGWNVDERTRWGACRPRTTSRVVYAP